MVALSAETIMRMIDIMMILEYRYARAHLLSLFVSRSGTIVGQTDYLGGISLS
jgi:hypothetical protein